MKRISPGLLLRDFVYAPLASSAVHVPTCHVLYSCYGTRIDTQRSAFSLPDPQNHEIPGLFCIAHPSGGVLCPSSWSLCQIDRKLFLSTSFSSKHLHEGNLFLLLSPYPGPSHPTPLLVRLRERSHWVIRSQSSTSGLSMSALSSAMSVGLFAGDPDTLHTVFDVPEGRKRANRSVLAVM